MWEFSSSRNELMCLEVPLRGAWSPKALELVTRVPQTNTATITQENSVDQVPLAALPQEGQAGRRAHRIP